jgi:hypothetical protein
MRLFHTATAKELLDLRNAVVLDVAIPTLLDQGFKKSPFSTSWFGRNDLKDFNYEVCRLVDSKLEIITIYIARGDRWVKFHLNIFELYPKPETIDDLNGSDGLQYHVPPNSLSNMHWRLDDINGIPLFSLRYLLGHKLKRFYSKHGLDRSVKKLSKTIKTDTLGLDHFIRRWYQLHQPTTTSWTGNRIDTN